MRKLRHSEIVVNFHIITSCQVEEQDFEPCSMNLILKIPLNPYASLI